MELATATESRSGKTDRAMKASGAMGRPTDRESSNTLMAISTRANGSTTKPTAMVPTHMLMAPSTKDLGAKTNSTDLVLRLGLTEQPMKANIAKA